MSAAQKPITAPLLIEIGCEEIPARFLTGAQKDFGERLKVVLKEAQLLPVGAVCEPPPQRYSTPRRLVAFVPAVLEQQQDATQEILGPPANVAFDSAGKPTRAAESFAAKNAAKVKDLLRVTTPKGEYLALKKTTRGRPAVELLREILPGVVAGLGFPKSMYWEKSGLRFVRPIRWLLALLGEGKRARVVPFEIAGVKSGRVTNGHRGLSRRIPVQSFDDYSKKLRRAFVEFDPEKRRAKLRQEIKVLLEGSVARAGAVREPPLQIVRDEELEDWIVNSTEWPRTLLGGFEERFLKLPREILITVMRDHQKYFATEDGQGELQRRFVTVLNQKGDPKGLIRPGHERVLTARFRDAEFFWDADQKVPLRDRQPMLQRVTYQRDLGSYADKVDRMKELAPQICGPLKVMGKLSDDETSFVLRAVELCKCDLTTQMVQEFPELQGVVGSLYAEAQAERQEVAIALYDHYKPVNLEDEVPRSLIGFVVSLADKIDSVVAGLSIGLEPTGSSDPFGFRRQGNSLIKLLVHLGDRYNVIELSLKSLLGSAAYAVPKTPGKTTDQVSQAAFKFLKERLQFYLTSHDGIELSVVRAVLSAEWYGFVPRARARAKGLADVVASDDFAAVCAAAKRIRNILAQAKAAGHGPAGVNFGRFESEAERRLSEESKATAQEVGRLDAERDYRSAFEAMAKLRPRVDTFFDKVLVMTDDPNLRGNRLGILDDLNRLLSSIADLSQIESTTLDVVDASTSVKQGLSAGG